ARPGIPGNSARPPPARSGVGTSRASAGPSCFHSGAYTGSTRGCRVQGIPPSARAPPLAPENSPDAGVERVDSFGRFRQAPANARSTGHNRTAMLLFVRSPDSPSPLSLSPDRHHRLPGWTPFHFPLTPLLSVLPPGIWKPAPFG